MSWAVGLVLLVAAQRLGEVALANRNTRRLLAAGGREVGARHYPLFILLHGAWLAALLWHALGAPTIDLPLLLVFLLLQVGRVWVIASLGRYWTTRVITLDDRPLVRTGPFRYFEHPNYLIVVLEIAVLPICLGAPWIALVFSLLNAALIAFRLSVENQALAARR
ncbi:MAG: isoprenylcysteine carboxylmethyltransferase family protein [Alphaproteobacteria bacterium]|nr:isoprenylcysteine carboxylmethyltransferase family protein [Alphaproteobacteria bacterium]